MEPDGGENNRKGECSQKKGSAPEHSGTDCLGRRILAGQDCQPRNQDDEVDGRKLCAPPFRKDNPSTG